MFAFPDSVGACLWGWYVSIQDSKWNCSVNHFSNVCLWLLSTEESQTNLFIYEITHCTKGSCCKPWTTKNANKFNFLNIKQNTSVIQHLHDVIVILSRFFFFSKTTSVIENKLISSIQNEGKNFEYERFLKYSYCFRCIVNL